MKKDKSIADMVVGMTYYDFCWRHMGGKLSKNRYTAEKTGYFGCYSKGIAIIVDIGCGNGAITRVHNSHIVSAHLWEFSYFLEREKGVLAVSIVNGERMS